jgi:hypothetical protein
MHITLSKLNLTAHCYKCKCYTCILFLVLKLNESPDYGITVPEHGVNRDYATVHVVCAICRISKRK